jgi:hypothetical protein
MTTKNKIALFKKLMLTSALLVSTISTVQAEQELREKNRPKLVRVAPAPRMNRFAQLEQDAIRFHENATRKLEQAKKENEEADADLKIMSSVADYALHFPKGTAEKVARVAIGERTLDIETARDVAQQAWQSPAIRSTAEAVEKEVEDNSFWAKIKRFFICH